MKTLTDGDLMPFGFHRLKKRKLMDIPLSYWRWFLCSSEQRIRDVRQQWPSVVAYAVERLSTERAAASRQTPAKAAAPAPPLQKSDPAKAASALAALKQFQKENR